MDYESQPKLESIRMTKMMDACEILERNAGIEPMCTEEFN
jgi:hypothetical protein